MSSTIDVQTIKEKPIKFWTIPQIVLTMLFAHPAIMCFFLSNNCKKLGEKRLSENFLLAGVFIAILSSLFSFYIPEKTPLWYSLGTIYLIAIFYVLYVGVKKQKTRVEECIDQGDRRFSYWIVAGLITLYFFLDVLVMAIKKSNS